MCKITYLLVPLKSKILTIFRLRSRVINQLNNLRLQANKFEDYTNLLSKILLNEKIIALDVGAQGGFNQNIFPKKYNNFFSPIMVEPIKDEAKKLNQQNYKVISKGLWSNNCVKKLYVMKKRLGSSSMYKPNKDIYALYDLKKKKLSLI